MINHDRIFEQQSFVKSHKINFFLREQEFLLSYDI